MGLAEGNIMIGSKKLSTIREEIEEALASAGNDPIQRLESLMASARRKGESIDVMEDLKRFLSSPRKRKLPKRGIRSRR